MNCLRPAILRVVWTRLSSRRVVLLLKRAVGLKVPAADWFLG